MSTTRVTRSVRPTGRQPVSTIVAMLCQWSRMTYKKISWALRNARPLPLPLSQTVTPDRPPSPRRRYVIFERSLTPVSELSGLAHLRSAALGLYDVPRTRTLMGSKAFSVAGPTAWNSLPQSLRDISSATTFKRHLKTHHFNCAHQ